VIKEKFSYFQKFVYLHPDKWAGKLTLTISRLVYQGQPACPLKEDLFMRRIIDRKRYDTETAELIGDFFNGLSDSDFNYISEELYRTKTGTFFLAGEGGAATHWAREYGNASTEGEGIQVLSADEALKWAEEHCKAEIIEKYFGDMVSEG
jgi:hypothetical protein